MLILDMVSGVIANGGFEQPSLLLARTAIQQTLAVASGTAEKSGRERRCLARTAAFWREARTEAEAPLFNILTQMRQ